MSAPIIYALMVGGFLGLGLVMWLGFRRDLANERDRANDWRDVAHDWRDRYDTERELRNERTLRAAHRDLAPVVPIGGRG